MKRMAMQAGSNLSGKTDVMNALETRILGDLNYERNLNISLRE